MYYLWITLALIAITLIVVRPVKNSAALILIIGTLYYGIPLFYGKVALIVSYQPFLFYSGSPPNELYLYYSLLLIAGAIALNIPNVSPMRDVNTAALLSGPLLLVAILFITTEIFRLGIGVYTTYSKSELLEVFSSLYSYHQMAYCLAAIAEIGFIKKPRKLFLAALSILFALDVLVVGMRGVPAFALLSALFARGVNFEIRVSNKVKLFGLLSIVPLVVVLTVWQAVFYFIKDWQNMPDISSYFASQFEDLTSFQDTVVLWGEPNASMGLATETIRSGFSFDFNALYDIILSIFPFLESIGLTRINPQVLMQQYFFPEMPWGMAASYSGELYAFLGFFGLLIHPVIMFFLALFKIPGSGIIRLLYFYMLPYFFFYFFRNSIFSYSNQLKALIITVSLAYLLMLLGDIFGPYIRRGRDSLHD